MQTAALYIRVSTDRQDELSPDAQKRVLTEYAEKNNMIVSSEYVFYETGISGKKADKRPAFQKMIAQAKSKEHPIDVILVWKYSRFARNQEESIVYKSLLKKNDVEVISISEPVLDGPFGTLIERIIEWMDEYYSINLAGEVTRGMTEKAMKGGYQARPPLGYTIKVAKEPPVIVPEEAAIVKIIFDKYVYDGLTFFQIARYLNNLGYKTDRGKNFERRSIEYIIQNPTYKGYIRWNRTHNATNTIKDEDEWIIEKGEHEAIISEELFAEAQERVKREYTPRKNERPVTEYKHWLSTLIKCNNCGRSLTASNVRNSKYKHFNCNGYTKGKCLVSNSISESVLIPFIFSTLENIIKTGDVDFEVRQKDNKMDTYLLEQQLKKLEIKEKRIKDAYINEIDTLEEYKHNKEIMQKEREQIQNQINDINKVVVGNNKQDMLNRISEVYAMICNDKIDNITKNTAMKSIIDRIVINRKEEIIDIYFYYS